MKIIKTKFSDLKIIKLKTKNFLRIELELKNLDFILLIICGKNNRNYRF